MNMDSPAAAEAARVTEVLAEVNRTHGTDYVVVEKTSGGMNHGAWLVRDHAGEHAILKVGLGDRIDHFRHVKEIVNDLRATGYPTPAWLAIGTDEGGECYQVQEWIPGRPAGRLTLDAARQMVDVLERHAGRDPYPDRDWSAYVRDELDVALAVLRREGGPAEAELADHYQGLVAGIGRPDLPRDDLVHGDFNTCNVLMHAGQLRGVIDVGQLGSGTRAIDYAWLLRETYVDGTADPRVIPMLRRAGEAVAGPDVLAFCTAVTALDIVRWLAHHAPAGVSRVIPRLHVLADALAQPL